MDGGGDEVPAGDLGGVGEAWDVGHGAGLWVVLDILCVRFFFGFGFMVWGMEWVLSVSLENVDVEEFSLFVFL